GTSVEAITSSANSANTVVLNDGGTLDADLVFTGLGSSPNIEWLTGSEISLEDGIRTDSYLRAVDAEGVPLPAIAAAGDVAQFPHPRFGDELIRIEHWSNAADQARTAAHTVLSDLTGVDGALPYSGIPSFWSDQYDQKI